MFCTLIGHILLIKCSYDDGRSLAKIVFQARVNASDAKIWNISPCITILMGFKGL